MNQNRFDGEQTTNVLRQLQQGIWGRFGGLQSQHLGNFFNRQHRATATYQVVEAISGSQNALGGLHLFKAGIDVLRSEYGGTSDSRPVLLERADGTLARRLDFALPSTESIGSTDLALFV